MKKVWIPVVVAVVTALGVIIAAFVSRSPVPPPPTPVVPGPTNTVPSPGPTSPSVPSLNGSYTGTMLRSDGQPFQLIISNLSEDQNGDFMASGYMGSCTTSFSGTIYSDNTLSFDGQESASATGCTGDASFTGELFSDGHLGGNWNFPNINASGTWNAS